VLCWLVFGGCGKVVGEEEEEKEKGDEEGGKWPGRDEIEGASSEI